MTGLTIAIPALADDARAQLARFFPHILDNGGSLATVNTAPSAGAGTEHVATYRHWRGWANGYGPSLADALRACADDAGLPEAAQ